MTIGSYKMTVNGSDVSDFVFGNGANVVKYRDNMGLVSDTLDVSLNDSTLDSRKYFPDGAEVEAEFTTPDGGTLKTGKLFVDTYDGRIASGGDSGGHELNIGTNSQPAKRPGMRTFIAYSKKKVKLKVLLEDVLKKAGLGLEYRFNQAFQLPWDIELKNIVIQNQMLAYVLRQYAELFGCFLKLYDDRVIFVNKMAFKLDPVLKIVNPSEDSIRNFRYDINEHNFEEYQVSYYNPRTGKTTSDKKGKNSVLITESQTIKSLIEQIADATAARALAMAVDGQRQALITFETDGTDKAIAGGIWQMNELNELTGKYVITSAQHTVAKNWNVEISAENIF